MNERSFSQEEEQADSGSTSGSENDPEYTFEGFKVEFSDKVMLTPPASRAKK